jgi:PRC-barrel domain
MSSNQIWRPNGRAHGRQNLTKKRLFYMLYKSKTLAGYKLHGLDGVIGKTKEFYFDDHHWTVRYLVAETGSWLKERQVLISPYALEDVNEHEKQIDIHLTKMQIANSPSLDSDKPVSRQFEEDYYGYYEWPSYWGGPYTWGTAPYPERHAERRETSHQADKSWDPQLRSSMEVSSYSIQANDGEIGHVDDFVIDDDTWEIRYLVVDTLNWWPGKKVLISTKWIERVSWSESKVFLNLDRAIIKDAPEYSEDLLLTRDFEEDLHRHYSREGYWVEESVAMEVA